MERTKFIARPAFVQRKFFITYLFSSLSLSFSIDDAAVKSTNLDYVIAYNKQFFVMHFAISARKTKVFTFVD